MEIRVLEYFLALAREQSISGAAKALHLSQPTLSRQLKDLEDELGKTLFERGNRKITLTADGMILRKRADEIVELVTRTQEEFSHSDESVAGTVSIGAGETDAMRVIAKTIKIIQKECLLVHFNIVSGDARSVTEELDKGLIDFALILNTAQASKYDRIEIPLKDKWGVLMRKDSPLAEKTSIDTSDLKDVPLLVSRQAMDRSELAGWFEKSQMKPNIVATYNLIFNASIMVDEGVGVALTLDKLINTAGDSTLTFRPLHPSVTLGMNIVWKKYLVFTKAEQLFIKTLQQVIENTDII